MDRDRPRGFPLVRKRSRAGLPPNLFGGLAILKVHIIAASGFEAYGLLTITFTLGDQMPSSATEGIRLNVQDIINFNKRSAASPSSICSHSRGL